MRARIAALAALLLSVTYLFDQLAPMPAELSAVRGFGLILAALWCTVEAFAVTNKETSAIKALEAAKSDAQSALDVTRAQTVQAIEAGKAEALRAVEAAKAEAQAAITAAKSEATRAQAALAKAEAALNAERLKTPEREVLGLLSLLQSRGRFIDFLMDDITKYPDAQVGAAARVVHQGCVGVVREYFDIKPVRQDAEGSSLTLEKDFDTQRVRLLGKVLGEPPFRGRLLHRGWQTAHVHLPQVQTDGGGTGLISPAEVELN